MCHLIGCPLSDGSGLCGPPPLPQLITVLRLRLSRYRTTIEEDEAIIADPAYGPRPTVAARLLKAEKLILQASLGTLSGRKKGVQGRAPSLRPLGWFLTTPACSTVWGAAFCEQCATRAGVPPKSNLRAHRERAAENSQRAAALA